MSGRHPTAVVGILGGGQLGRMLALAAVPLGIGVRVLDPAPDLPAAAVAAAVAGGWDDTSALDALAAGATVVTWEVETVPLAAIRHLSMRAAVRPPARALEVAGDRLDEKLFLAGLGIPTAAFAPVDVAADAQTAIAATGLPAIIKTRRMGYDGRGQRIVRDLAGLRAAHADLGGGACILEAVVPFDRELAVLAVAVTGTGGHHQVRCYPVVETRQRQGMLHTALAPAPHLAPAVAAAAEEIAATVVRALEYTGVLAVELFQVGDEVIANEIAPRVHNSGHWTIEAADCSQFENHLRAILGLPLGSTAARGPSGTVNLVGHHPPIDRILEVAGAHLHLYGKAEREHRKLGHVTVTAATEAERDSRVAAVEAILGSSGAGVSRRAEAPP